MTEMYVTNSITMNFVNRLNLHKVLIQLLTGFYIIVLCIICV